MAGPLGVTAVGSGVAEHLAALEPSCAWRWDPELWATRGGAWTHALLFVLTLSLYAKYPVCRVPTSARAKACYLGCIVAGSSDGVCKNTCFCPCFLDEPGTEFAELT
jgi:hypothetical protein